MTRPKVIHVTTTDMSLELLLGPQLHAFAEAGYEVVGASAPGPYSARLEASGIRHVPLHHSTRSMALARDLRATAEMYQVFRRERPDIVHLHNPKPGWFGRPAAALARVPGIVNTVHGLYATEDDPPAFRALVYALERFAATWSDVELVQNPEDVDQLRRLGVADRKLVTLGNGIDLDRFSPSRPDPAEVARFRDEAGLQGDEVLVGAVGRLVWEKGLREVFEAARILRERCPRARFVVIGPLDPEKGDGLTAADLEQITAELGVHFAGERLDMDVVYAALDVYVLASHREGFPRSAMEAAAMGTPVLATDIRGCRQVVDHGVDGLLFPVADPAALADAVQQVVEDDARRAAMATAAARRALVEFDQQRVIDLTLDAYARVLASR
ncbi:MAG: glycosyltransferase family 4 protein [Acidimicrobiales bacterium]